MAERRPSLIRALDRERHQSFLTLSAHYLIEYADKIERAVEDLPEEQIWWRANTGCNSIGNLLLHLAGNLSLWILKEVGGRGFQRQRDAEFAATGGLDAAELTTRLRTVIEECATILRQFDEARLSDDREIQGFSTDVRGAIYHAVEHTAYHTGQILALAKQHQNGLKVD